MIYMKSGGGITLVGKYNITIKDKKAEYFLCIKRKYTLITGDSSTGKTRLYNMLASGRAFVNVSDSSVDISALPRDSKIYKRLLPAKDPIIYVVDESVTGINSAEFFKLMKDSNAYFILMSRKLLAYLDDKKKVHALPLAIDEIYEIEGNSVNGVYYQDRLVNRYSLKSFSGDIRYILTEDSNSGYKVYSHCYKDAFSYSSNGNSNILKELKYICKEYIASKQNGYVAVFVDGAAYGAYAEMLMSFIGRSNIPIVVFAPESFEWLLLQVIPDEDFVRYIDKGILHEIYNYCDEDHFKLLVGDYSVYDKHHNFESWEQFCTELLIYAMSGSARHKEKGGKVSRAYTKKDTLPNYYYRFSNEIRQLLEG